MAIQTIRIDDFDGVTTEGVKPVSFSLDGERYTLDLGAESLAALKDSLKPFIKKATKAAASSGGTGKARPGILTWAKEQGLVDPNYKGRVPASVIEAYDAR